VLLVGEIELPVGQCQPKVADFGLVRLLDSDSNQTFDGMVMGTPSYMAPEQAGGVGAFRRPGRRCLCAGRHTLRMLNGPAGSLLATQRAGRP